MSRGVMMIWLGVIVAFAALMLCLLWFLLSPRFTRMLKRLELRDKFFVEPRKIALDFIRRGLGLRLAYEFLTNLCDDSAVYMFETVVEVGLSGEELNSQESIGCALIDLYCDKQVWRRYLKRFPAYIDIGGFDFSPAIEKFGGCAKKYEQL